MTESGHIPGTETPDAYFKFDVMPFSGGDRAMFWGAQYCQAKGFVFDSLLDDNRVCSVLGDRGTGKTLLARKLFEDAEESTVIAHIMDPEPAAEDFLREVLKAFGFDSFTATRAEYLNILRAFIDHEQARGKTPVLVVDRAETLTPEVHDELARLVRIRQTDDDNFRIVFFGRPLFEADLDKTNLGDQAPRRFHLYGMSEEEIGDYIFHQLDLAGRATNSLFTPAALRLVSSHSGGIPLLVNEICREGLRRAAQDQKKRVIKGVIEGVVDELKLPYHLPRSEARYSVAPSSSPFRPEGSDKIVITHSGRVEGTYLLTHRRTMIGRHPTSDILLNRSSVSLHHAQILVDDRGAHLLDMQSTNGTFVNFKRVQHKLLSNSDLILVGEYRMKFVAGLERQLPSRPPELVRAFAETVVLAEAGDELKRPGHLRRIK